MEKLESLWGEEIEEELPVKKKEKTKKALDKIAKPKKPKEAKEAVEKVIKSKSINLEDKLNLIKSEVLRVLAKQVENVIVITSREQYFEYLQGAVNSGVIAVDTETNNSLDPITCKLMGLCLYYPGAKQAYIPVNHRNYKTGERLTNQLTEQDIKEGLEFVLEKSFSRDGWTPDYEGQTYFEWYQNHIEPLSADSSIEWVFHNGKFDYQVIKKTCGIEVPITWDTLLGAKLIDENEFSAGLKQQYVSKIDPEQEKYDIEHLFEGVEYADVDASLFALYAATDSYMTYRLYKEYQLPIFESKDYADVYKLFREIEVPCITVTAEMELNGIEIDQEYSKRLQNKYHARLEKLDAKLINLLDRLKETIDNWKNTNDALQSQMKKQSEKQRANALKSANYDDSLWKYQDGIWYKSSKSKLEQLGENLTPKELGSPVKLAILLYSILKAPRVNDEKPDGTGEDELKAIIRKSDNNDVKELCNLMLDRRELDKLLNSFIDTLPNKVNVDNRIHCHFNQYGAATGRFSCISEGTLISCPSGDKKIEDIQVGTYVYCYTDDNHLTLSKVKNVFNNGKRDCVKLYWKSKYNAHLKGELICTPDHFIKTTEGWKMAKDLKPTDSILYVHRRLNDKGTVSLYANFNQGNEEEHAWIREEWYHKSGTEFDIHHLDHNRSNNDPINLVPVEKATHTAIHLSENQSTYCGKYNISREDLIKQCEEVNWEIRRLNYDFDSVKQWLKQYRINYILEYTNSYSRRFYEVDEKTNKAKKPLHLPLNKSNITYALDLSNGDISLAASYFGVSVELFKERADNYEILSNHNIYKIEYLESSYQVYDLEVEKYHNFIAGELCVHNCSEPNLQQIPSHNKEIRMMFSATTRYNDIESEDNTFIVPYTDEVETDNGWKYMKDVLLTDKIKFEDIFCSILEITKINEQGDYKLVLEYND